MRNMVQTMLERKSMSSAGVYSSRLGTTNRFWKVHIYENLYAEVLAEDMKMCEIVQANVLIKKFPPSWNDYRNHLKHKKKDLTLQELINRIQTDETN